MSSARAHTVPARTCHGARACALLLMAALLATGCDGAASPGGGSKAAPGAGAAPLEDPAHARWDLVQGLRADVTTVRDPSDGGGSAWLESGDPVPAGSPGRWTIVYEAGPLGVAVGGQIVLQISPFWGWSEPQPVSSEHAGFTTLETDAEGVTLDVLPPIRGQPSPRALRVAVGGRPLAPGEQVRFVYGAGDFGARADTYAEGESRFWIGVDGDGDGVHAKLAGSPATPVLPGPPARMVATLTSRARPGDPVRLTLAVLDARGNAGTGFVGALRLHVEGGDALTVPPTVTLAPDDGGTFALALSAGVPGVARVAVTGLGGLTALSNPLLVADDAEPLLWADLHGHSSLSDGTGTPEDYYAYARDVAALDVAVLTDHDHWGMLALDAHPDMWSRITAATAAFHEPGRFVTLLGYEWTNWIHGHRHVLYFDDEGEVLSSLDEEYDTPAELWAALEGQAAITVAHHSAGGPVPTNWTYRPDPVLEPVTEVMSVHGSSEAPDSPRLIYSPVSGNFVRDVLDRGVRFGLIGSGDSHDGHPGLTHLADPRGHGGLGALLTGDRSRAGVLAALRARRTYATSGARIVLHVDLDGAGMGQVLATGSPGRLQVDVHGTAPLARLEIVRAGAVVATREIAADTLDANESFSLAPLQRGEYVYVRVVQRDLGLAWSSPVFVD